MLELVDLAGYGDRRGDAQLSGGQQQRVALARALVNRPALLLLDEPLGALDLKLRKQMQLELKRIQSEVGITFIYVTHDQDEAMTMSDRLAVMNAGKIEQIGVTTGGIRVAGHCSSSPGSSARPISFRARSWESRGRWPRSSSRSGGECCAPRRPASGASGRGARRRASGEARDSLPVNASQPASNSIDGDRAASPRTRASAPLTNAGRRTDRRSIVYVQNLGTDVETLGGGAKVRLPWDPEHTFAVTHENGLAVKEEAHER